MSRMRLACKMITLAALMALVLLPATADAQMTPAAGSIPKVGDKARDFTLTTMDGTSVRLSDELKSGPVVLLMMRGWPGYQCPFCTRQFGDYLTNAQKLKATGVRTMFVYPGPIEGLKEHADAFIAGRGMPANFTFLIDPNYTFTNAYGLRWNEPKETAYPTTFVLDKSGVVRFAKTSKVHGDRVPVSEVLAAIAALR